MSLFPALLTIFPMRPSPAVDRQSRSMQWLANMVIAKRRPLMLAMLAVTFIGTAMLPRLTFNDRFVEYFDERVDFRKASDWAADNLTGIYIVNYSLESPVWRHLRPRIFVRLNNFATCCARPKSCMRLFLRCRTH